MNKLRSKLEQNLGWAALLALAVGCLIVLRPFVSALLWAVVLCFSSWPLYRRLLQVLGNRRTLAAGLMTLIMVLVLLMPFVIIGTTLGSSIKELTLATRDWIQGGPPDVPAWLEKVPIVGATAVEYWQSLAHDTARLWTQAQRFVEPVSAWLIRAGLALVGGLLELALSIFIAFFLFRNGVSAAQRLAAAIERIGGERGHYLLEVAGKTVRGVVYGILGTALAQAVLAGIGFTIAGVPGPALLALLTFFLSVVPVLGTALVWGPAAFWLFNQGSTGWAIFVVIWGLGVANIDNFIKPWLISQGSDMPFILIFFGVLGGAIAFGFIGVFLGPTLLAVGFRLVEKWSAGERTAVEAGEQPQKQ
ncbi:MAG TPA: AI-2E family transporter [Verrucomicrobiota bacterium]|jgi:predicted PurR-regulated permease PerM|nr:AI-2E family transporter [Verrucomicrobiota bacterium]HQL79071.1 AI-2E family transporter [Verrucomicrobiota bacterium]